jgi:hypothetical protein
MRWVDGVPLVEVHVAELLAEWMCFAAEIKAGRVILAIAPTAPNPLSVDAWLESGVDAIVEWGSGL